MNALKVVSEADWLTARKELLEKEKELSRQRDELTRLRQELPWRKVEQSYEFDGPNGIRSLLELFGESRQLLVYHFMFAPDWKEGCKACSLVADHYDPLVIHLKARDVSMVTVSRAPIETLDVYKQRMGWSFDWVSSFNNQFNQDFGVTFTEEEKNEGRMNYNFRLGSFPVTECPGISSFARNEDGEVFHTYSAYSRGLENILGIYNLLDLVPKGRDEAQLPYGMAWVRHHDQYGDETVVDPYA